MGIVSTQWEMVGISISQSLLYPEIQNLPMSSLGWVCILQNPNGCSIRDSKYVQEKKYRT